MADAGGVSAEAESQPVPNQLVPWPTSAPSSSRLSRQPSDCGSEDASPVAAAAKPGKRRRKRRRKPSKAVAAPELLSKRLYAEACRKAEASHIPQAETSPPAQSATIAARNARPSHCRVQGGTDKFEAEPSPHHAASSCTGRASTSVPGSTRATPTDDHRELKSELHKLKLEDAKARRECLERKANFRREELEQHIANRNQRMELLKTVKDTFQQQRRSLRTVKRTGESRPAAPGPGHYTVPSGLSELPKWSMSSTAPRQDLWEAAVKQRASHPAPGAYSTTSQSRTPGACFKGPRGSMFDDVIRAKEAVPAPGQYSVPAGFDARVPVMRPQLVSAPAHSTGCGAIKHSSRGSVSLPLLLAA